MISALKAPTSAPRPKEIAAPRLREAINARRSKKIMDQNFNLQVPGDNFKRVQNRYTT